MRKVDLKLSSFQIVAIISAIAFIVALVKLYHHQSDVYTIPFLEYLGTFRIAVPPIALLILSYSLLFFAGIKLSDAPHFVISVVRGRYLQSIKSMTTGSSLFILCSLIIIFYTQNNPEPHYIKFVSTVLGSEQDRGELIGRELKITKKNNSDLEKKYRLVVETFNERSKRNFSNSELGTTTPRILVRALSDTDSDQRWESHPLRMLALAEAYSMWGQASLNSSFRRKSDESWKKYFEYSIENNLSVANSDSRLATQLVKSSAYNNAGNAALYAGDYNSAKKYYESTLNQKNNLSSAGNLIAIYVLLGDLDSAKSFGQKTIEWGVNSGKALTEGSSFSSVLVNLSFAYLISGEYKESTDLLIQAYDLEDDNLNAINLAVSFALLGDLDSAEESLSAFRYPSLDIEQQQSRAREDYNRCYYLVKGLLIDETDYSSISAHLNLYLSKALTENQIRLENKTSIDKLKFSVLKKLEKDPTPCGHLNLIPGFRALLRSDIVQEKPNKRNAADL